MEVRRAEYLVKYIFSSAQAIVVAQQGNPRHAQAKQDVALKNELVRGAKVGKVTGGLADALNWSSEAAEMFAGYMSEDVVTAEDAFNEALAECSTEAERQALINETLLALYGSAADKYEETAAGVMSLNEAQAEYCYFFMIPTQ